MAGSSSSCGWTGDMTQVCRRVKGGDTVSLCGT